MTDMELYVSLVAKEQGRVLNVFQKRLVKQLAKGIPASRLAGLLNSDRRGEVSKQVRAWAHFDYSQIESRLLAQDPEWFKQQYFTHYENDAMYSVKLRYDLTPAADTSIVDWRHLMRMVQPITAAGVSELSSLRANQIAHTNQYTITRIQ